LAERDGSRYVLKDRKQRTVQTLVGDVTFTRRYYCDNAEQRWCFLLVLRGRLQTRGFQ